ncbi:MAG: sugar phosphate isomerase/epimerase [Rhodospirillales bacterium]|nr:sugar phosphate isomerase/epimerase [Rhodospirillales bacterium]
MTSRRHPAERLVHRGIGHVEFYDLPPAEVEDMAPLLERFVAEGRAGFSFHTPIARGPDFPYSPIACFFLSENETKRELSFAQVERTLQAARRWGAGHVVTHLTYGPGDTKDADAARKLAAAACRRFAELSRETEIPLDIEFAAYTESFHRPDDFLDVIAPHSELGICIDVGHAGLGALIRNRDVAADVETLASKARSLHLWNTLGLEHTKKFHHSALHPSQSPADGWLDVPRLTETVLRISPQVKIIFEYPVDRMTPEIQEGYDWISAIAVKTQK